LFSPIGVHFSWKGFGGSSIVSIRRMHNNVVQLIVDCREAARSDFHRNSVRLGSYIENLHYANFVPRPIYYTNQLGVLLFM